ncbi:hypothetical protein MKX01_035317 [Papaver californicum]|nr:hypothetical protein MKX01_035317 [Papaver californicum]
MVGMTQALYTQFKSCRLLLGNVWHKELSIVQRRILRKLRSKKRSRSRNVVANQNSHIQLATRRKLSLFYHEGIHRRERTTSEFVPFLLDLETRLDVLLVRTHFCQSIPQARQLISHRRVCVNNTIRSINHFKVSPGDVISFQNNEAVSAEIRKSLFCSVLKIIGQVQNQPIRLWRKTKVEWLRLLKTKAGSRILMKSAFLKDLHTTTQEAGIEKSKKTGSAAVCLGSHFAEHNKMKRHLYNFTWRVLNLAQNMTIPK